VRYAPGTLAKAAHLLPICVAIAALCSGGASLTLEVVWSKALVVPLGNSSDATALVLSGFMLGIAGGARLGARLAAPTEGLGRLLLAMRGTATPPRCDSDWQNLWIYAGLEALLGLFALFVPSAVKGVTGLNVGGSLASLPQADFGLRLLASIALISLPCLVMGATLPLLLATPAAGKRPRLFTGILYGTNTLGATLAAVITGFYGVANWGISGCSRRAALLSGTAALIAMLAGRPRRRGDGAGCSDSVLAETGFTEERNAALAETATRIRDRRRALATTFVSGFVLLSAEVLWARVLTFVFGHDTYAFATLLAVVLLGLSLGGLAYAAVANWEPRRVAGWSMALFALSLVLSFYGASWLLVQRGRDPFQLGDSFIGRSALSLEMLKELSLTPVLVFLPSLFSGIGYPSVIALHAGRHGSVSRATGSIGLANGLGATLGSGATALGLVSWCGIQGTLSLAALAAAAAATWLLFCDARTRIRQITALLPGAGTLVLVATSSRDLPKRILLSVVGPRHQILVHYAEARTASVAVIRNTIHGERQLLVNAVNEVTTRLVHDQSFKLLGQLGPLLHENPKNAVMICLGAGLAAGSALTHPLERLDVVDLLQAVRDGARHFSEENNHVLDDGRLILHVNDGRQHLLATADRYDLAIVDSTHPKSVDSWILYTREFFHLLRSRLKPNGIVVQWLPLHGLSEREFISVVATFASVFPEMTLWASVGYETYGQVGYAKLVGQRSDAPMLIDTSRMAARLALPAVRQDLARYGMDRLPEILDQFVAGPARIRDYVANSPLLTDDRPFLAYLTELSAGRPMTPDRLLLTRESVRPYLLDLDRIDPQLLTEIERSFDAQGLVMSGQLERAKSFFPTGEKIRLYVEQTKTTLPYYTALAKSYPNDVDRLFEAATQLGALGHGDAAGAIFGAGLERNPDSLRLGLNAGLLFLGSGEAERAARHFSELRRHHPGVSLLDQNLGVALLAQGEPGAAKRTLTSALLKEPARVSTRLALAETEAALENWPAAKAILETLVREDPRSDAALSRLADIQEMLGNPAAAIELSARAARMDPYRDDYAVAWGRRLTATDPSQALAVLQRAEYLHPESSKAKIALGETWLRLRQWQKASQHFVSALELDPRAKDAAIGLGRALAALDQKGEAKDAFCLAWKLDAPRHLVLAGLQSIGEKSDGCGMVPL
jgi:spermidine synthase